jgi:uncharacterized protein (TIGR03086 family)
MTATTTWTVLDRAHAALRTATAGLTSADLGRPTPCTEWTVAQVLQHAAGDQLAYTAAITGHGGPTEDPFAPSGTLAGTPAELVEPALVATAAAFATLDPAGTTPTPLPHGVLPAATAAGAAALDAGVHAWDVAVATGQPSVLTDDLARELLPWPGSSSSRCARTAPMRLRSSPATTAAPRRSCSATSAGTRGGPRELTTTKF